MNLHHGPQLGLALLVVLAGCAPVPEGTDTRAPSPSPSASATEEPPAAPTGAFFLDLRTGEQTPLPSTGEEDFGAPLDGGNYYAASPDGSRVIYETTGCDASCVAAGASIDGSQGGRLDPTGPINYYAGGWSPDGTKIVYQRRDGSGDEVGDLFVEDFASGRRTRITDLGLGTVGWWYLAPIFSHDGRDVIFQLPRDRSATTGPTWKWDLWSVPVTGGEPTRVVRNAAQPAALGGPVDVFLRPRPDVFLGTHLVIATPDGARTLVEATSAIGFPKVSPDGSRITFTDAESIHVVEVSTGESTEVAVGRMATWLNDDTLIVAPDP